MNEEKTRLRMRQADHMRGHWRHIIWQRLTN